jgi:hypothetical protein
MTFGVAFHQYNLSTLSGHHTGNSLAALPGLAAREQLVAALHQKIIRNITIRRRTIFIRVSLPANCFESSR